ncbi:hypothetical protein HY623_02795 [Candidatus Uhrbacteria bacterium]|nr:hypothetical protein [Candidatus Uhrbacteria bacterium]
MTQLAGLPINLRKHFDRETVAELQALCYVEGDEIDKIITAAEAHVAQAARVREVALLN